MDKETLSNYGWIVICVMVLAVMLAFASPFGNFVADAIKSTTQGLFDVNQGALDSANIHIMQQEFENMLTDKDPALHVEGVTIENNTYSQGDYIYAKNIISGNPYGASTYEEAVDIVNRMLVESEGMTLQEFIDLYIQYGMTEEQALDVFELNESTFEPTVFGTGWSVHVIDDTKATYGVILESINNEPVSNMDSTFHSCYNLLTPPTIPQSITSMSATFYDCTSLTTAPIIPSGVTDVSYIFSGCESLKTYVGSTSLDGDFSNYIIPNSVTNMMQSFSHCILMTHAPAISSNTKDLSHAFHSCTALIKAPTIPEGVTHMYQTFLGCTSLTTAPIIPSSVISLCNTFWDCTALTGTITINTNNISNYLHNRDNSCGSCFQNVDMTNISLVGSASKDVLNMIGSTGNNWTPIE